METELNLLQAARTMNKDALGKIFDLYASSLYKYALRLCGEPRLADHIVGDVFARLIDQLASGKGPTTNLRAYLYETTYHRIIDEARYSQRWASLEALTLLHPDVGSGRLRHEDQILFGMVLDAIQKDLTIDQRHVVVLRFLEEFSLRETAAILRKEVSHIKVIQGRALAKLRRLFKSREIRTAATLRRVRKPSSVLSV